MKVAHLLQLRTSKFLWILLGVLIVTVGNGPTASAAQATLSAILTRLLTQYDFTDKDVGYLLFDPTSGHTLEEHRPDEPYIPASTTKVTTIIAALQILGAEYRFETSLLVTGEVKASILHGNLYLRGGGDPTLTTDDLRELTSALRTAGIKHITGEFLFDESFLSSAREINQQQPVAVPYNPGLSALSVNYNRILLRWKHKPKSATFFTTIRSLADGGSVPVTAISTGLLPPSFDRRIRFLLDGESVDHWLLSPTLPVQGQVELPVKTDPGRVAALLFRTLCQRYGIKLPAPQAAVVPSEARGLYTHRSAALPKIAAGVFRYSNNLSAELLGQVATRQLSGRSLPLHESAAMQVEWYRRLLPHLDWRGFFSANHSGLSSATRHSPQQLAAILRYGWTMPAGSMSFLQLLSPLQWKDKNGRKDIVIRAKSGTMDYADGLAGFLTTARGRQLGFVILLTDFAKRAALDAVYDVRLLDPAPEANSWTTRAKAFERALVTGWIARY